MKRYNPKAIEPKWQAVWEETGIYRATEDKTKPKRYVLEYFPYPSGAAMHVGHVRNYTIGDSVARFARMNGMNVLHPMGWDGFGLPAENYAIRHKISPQKALKQNTDKFRQQLMQMGFSYDWSREINSTDPSYYKWTQWLFLVLFKRELAYQAESLQWWCPVDKTVLADEQVEAGKCWRCGSVVEKKPLKQWFFKITDYADRLEKDLDKVDWSNSIKTMQRNWIGKSHGAEINFKIDGQKDKIAVFTTRADTIFSAAFIVIAPEHKLLDKLSISNDVKKYIKQSEQKSEIDRMETEREKTGLFTGYFAINPANNKKIPIWVADFVLAGYGTGAVFGDIHDERDFEFLKKFDIPAEPTVLPEDPKEAEKVKAKEYAYTGEGVLINSGEFSGMRSEAARDKIITWLANKNVAKEKINYKIRDWLISRQRYWGAPIPIIHCPKDGAVAVPDDDLPVVLPEVKSYEPSGDGRSPLANVPEFVNVKCPQCGGKAERETDTMDGFACSSWYFLRFADPQNDKKPFDKTKVDFWLPVDDYIGGAEHAVMHLLYARFWTKVMFDAKLINFDEPFSKLRNQGMILAPDGRKMSKSYDNTIEPDNLIEQGYGADSIRLMELFIGPWNQSANWSVEGLGGTFRFLQRVWTLVQEFLETKSKNVNDPEVETRIARTVHKAVKKVSDDMQELGFNTAIASLMECVNELYKIKAEQGFAQKETWQTNLSVLIQLLAPFAPHIAEELWQELGHDGSVHVSKWPAYDKQLVKEELITIAVQVNGKVRSELMLPADVSEEEAIKAAKQDDKVAKNLKGKKVKKTIYVPGRLISLVTD